MVGTIPSSFENLAAWRLERGDDRSGTDGVSPWWREVSSYTISSAMREAYAAFKAWMDSVAGRRAGRQVGYPRFKKRGRCRDSFRILLDSVSDNVQSLAIRLAEAVAPLESRTGGLWAGFRRHLSTLFDVGAGVVKVTSEGSRTHLGATVGRQVLGDVLACSMRSRKRS